MSGKFLICFLFFVLALLVVMPFRREAGACEFKNIPLYGKVKVVTSFADIKVRVVDSFPDLRVQVVTSFPDRCGRWQFVDSFPDFTIQFVDSLEDIKIKYVDSFPGKP